MERTCREPCNISPAGLMTPRDAAVYIGVKINTLAVWRMTNKYGLPYLKLGKATRDGNRSIAELKRKTAIKRLNALNNDLEAKQRACLEYGKAMNSHFKPPKDAKENFFGNKVTLPKEEYENLCRIAKTKGIEYQEKIALEVLLSERKDLDSCKAITEVQNRAKQAENENKLLKQQNDALRWKLHRILTAHPGIKKEREKYHEKGQERSGIER